MPKRKRIHPRPLPQLELVSWLNASQSRFSVRVRPTDFNQDGLTLNFQNYPDSLSVQLSMFSLVVRVDFQEACWEFLFSRSGLPKQVPGGYRNQFSTNFVKIFPTWESVWHNEVFEPFLSWVNANLAPANALLLYGRPDRPVGAALSYGEEQPSETKPTWVRIPLPDVKASETAL